MDKLITLKDGTTSKVGDVPCNGCTLCCHGDAVRLLPGDGLDYQVEPNPHFPGQFMLAHKPNGDCIYLEAAGCSIHARRPKMCREMDCRLVAQVYTKRRIMKVAHFQLSVWERGRELIKQSAK